MSVPTFVVHFNTGIDADYYKGSKTGTPVGSAATVNGKLELTYGDIRYVDYSAADNADHQQVGCIRFRFIPNYSGSPVDNRFLFFIGKDNSDVNKIALYHDSGGALRLNIYDENGDIIKNPNMGSWSPVSGTKYEFEFNWSLTTGSSKLFIDGVQKGIEITDMGIRSSDISILRIGSNNDGSESSNCSVDELLVFDEVQHTSDYTPETGEFDK